MKKIFLFSLLSFILGMNSAFAQDVLVANLSHNGTVTNFYGVNALKNAHEAAEHGDTIILSQGTFNTDLTITKAITILGAGMYMNADGQGTYFNNSFWINIADDVNTPMQIEGIITGSSIHFSNQPKNLIFNKCHLSGMNPSKTVTFKHCIMTGGLGGDGDKYLYNCYWRQSYDVSSIHAYNCVIYMGNASQFHNCDFYNSIIHINGWKYENTNTMFNTVSINAGNDVYDNITAGASNSISTFADIFKTYTGEYSDTETFELTDAAKTTYLGIDGTQVGMYGSATPFDPTPTIPLITSYQVAAKAANGKVSVNVEINGGED